jgi:hypothetical protein
MNEFAEVWKLISGFYDYEISNYGRVKSFRTRSVKILIGTLHAGGYHMYILKDAQGKSHVRSAHRLVGLHFLPPPLENQTDVCHNDGDPSYNFYKNLRWDTHQRNQMDMRSHGTMQDGEKSCTSKLTQVDVDFIREQVKIGKRGTARRLALQYGISVANISRIINGTRWTATFKG